MYIWGEKSKLNEFKIDHTVIQVDESGRMKSVRAEIEAQEQAEAARAADAHAAIEALRSQYLALKESAQRGEFKRFMKLSREKTERRAIGLYSNDLNTSTF